MAISEIESEKTAVSSEILCVVRPDLFAIRIIRFATRESRRNFEFTLRLKALADQRRILDHGGQ